MNCDVYLNGYFLGNHPYGYTAFEYDVTDYLVGRSSSGSGSGSTTSTTTSNVLAVRVCNKGKTSRWYSGSGIYRSSFLSILEGVHVPLWGVGIGTPAASVRGIRHHRLRNPTGTVSGTVSRDVAEDAPVGAAYHSTASSALVAITIEVVNHGTTSATVSAAVHIIEAPAIAPSAAINGGASRAVGAVVGAGTSAAVVLPANGSIVLTVNVSLASEVVRLWSPDSPTLYTANVSVMAGAADDANADNAANAAPTSTGDASILIDSIVKKFGIRTIYSSATTGFILNGKVRTEGG
jgi:beta-galactosidase